MSLSLKGSIPDRLEVLEVLEGEHEADIALVAEQAIAAAMASSRSAVASW
jgi:hypothetical protein